MTVNKSGGLSSSQRTKPTTMMIIMTTLSLAKSIYTANGRMLSHTFVYDSSDPRDSSHH